MLEPYIAFKHVEAMDVGLAQAHHEVTPHASFIRAQFTIEEPFGLRIWDNARIIAVLKREHLLICSHDASDIRTFFDSVTRMVLAAGE